MLGGYRVSSVQSAARDPHTQARKMPLSDKSKLLLSAIPNYPNSISIYKLAKNLGMSKREIEARLTTIEGNALISEWGGQLSRMDI